MQLHCNTTAQQLDLNRNMIGDEGATRTAEAMHNNTTLVVLWLGAMESRTTARMR
jgi:hypothetical protein